MASPFLLVDHGGAATTVQKKACRAAAAYATFAATPPPPQLLLLLLSHTGISSPCSKKNMLCFAMPTDLMEFRRFAHRKQSK